MDSQQFSSVTSPSIDIRTEHVLSTLAISTVTVPVLAAFTGTLIILVSDFIYIPAGYSCVQLCQASLAVFCKGAI